jgi:sugar phosphate isomerase/epimerase
MMRRPVLGSTTVCYPKSVGAAFTLERALVGIASVGLEYVELCSIPGYCEHVTPEGMSVEDARALRDKIASTGLVTRALNLAADLTTDPGIDSLVAGLELARLIGATVLVTNVDAIRDDETRTAFLRRVDRIAAAAERAGVRVGFETHGGICATGPQALEFASGLGSEWLGVTYDVSNVLYAGGVDPVTDLEAIVDDFASYVVHVHLKDKATRLVGEYDFPPFGEGIVDFERVLSLLDRTGYSGAMTLEVELDGRPATPELVDTAIASSLSYLVQFWDGT